MKKQIIFLLLFACSVLKGQTAFQHTTTSGNITDNYMTTLTNPTIDGISDAVIIIMPNRNVNNTVERNDAYSKNYGVWFNGKQWKIFTEDRSAMPVGLVFNVLACAKKELNSFSYQVTQADIAAHGFQHGAVINNSLTYGKDNAIVLVTHNGGKGTAPMLDNNSLIVSHSNEKWNIAHQNYMAYWLGLTASQQSFMKAGDTYNVIAVDAKACSKFNMIQGFTNANAFLYTVDACSPSGNIVGGFTSYIDDAKCNNTPTAMVFATPNWGWSAGLDCGKSSGPYNESPICVQYGFPGGSFFSPTHKWYIVNTKGNALPNGMKFNVFVINSK